MRPKLAGLLGALCLAGAFGLGWRQGSPDAPSVPVPPSSSKGSKFEAPGPASAMVPSPASPIASESRKPSVPAPVTASVESILDQARGALKSTDPAAFSKAYLALLDAGEPAWPALLDLARGAGGLQDLLAAFDMETQRGLAGKIGLRAARLSGLFDLVLREGEGASAIYLRNLGVSSGLPRDEQARLVLALLRKEASACDQDQGRLGALSHFLLLDLQAGQALPDVERLYTAMPARNRWVLAGTLGAMNRPESVSVLRGMFARNSDLQVRCQLLDALGQGAGEESNALLWEIEAQERSPEVRQHLAQVLARRPENLDRVLGRMKDPGTTDLERQGMLWSLLASGEKAREALWRLYYAEPAQQDAILQAALVLGDPKAKEIQQGRFQEPPA